MNKYDRMLFILNLLRTRKNMNADKLAEECGVTERSIYRDIISLSEMNIPIYYENGYKLASDNFLPPLNFSIEEYQLLKTALESSPLIKTDKYSKIYKSLIVKIDSCLSDNVQKEKKYSPLTTRIEIKDSIDDEHSIQFYELIEKAISTQKIISLKYVSIKSGESQREVNPYFIIFRGSAFYFVGYCHLKKEYRTFRMNRIIDVSITDKDFIKSDDISAESYFEGSWSVFSGKPVDVVALFSGDAAKVILSSVHHQNEQKEQLENGFVKYSVTTKGLEEIQRWLLRFGAEVEIVTPQELRFSLLRIGQALTEKYSH
ncbi:MAG TPA: YafY family transcriptional regulator [candidate division Zixibacteria bacterium]|nr:YafY family transcriptional regulator [candidate division Zixibacteria bacterium]